MERISLLIICLFCFLQVDAQFTQHGRTLEYHGRQSKTTYTSPVSIAFQGCSSTTNDKAGNLSLVFPNAKAGNVVSCTDLEISNSQYVIFNRNDFDIWTLGDRNLSIVLCKKSKIDSYVAIYTKVQMDVSNAKYEAKKKELYNSEQDKIALKKELEQLTKKHNEEIKEIKANALIFAYIDEEKMDSLQYEQHLCILNNDIKKAVEIGQQIDFKNNMSKQLSNFEASIKKSQEIGLKLFQEAEALYLHIANCELLSIEEDSLKDDYDILIKSYRSLLEQYPNNFKCSEEVYKKTKIKLGNILYKYADKVIDYKSGTYNESAIKCYMKEAASYNNSDAMLWFVEHHENRDTAKVYAKILLEGIESRKLNLPEDYSYYDIKDICNSIPDLKTENKSMVFYYTVLDSNRVSLTHVHCKDSTIRKIRIPEKVIYENNKYSVTEIGTCALGEASYVECLKVGERFVDENDFYTNLNFVIKDSSQFAKMKLIIPETITYIGAGAFDPRLSPVLFLLNGIPKNLEILRINSFKDCEFSSGEIIIPNKVKEIESDALPLWWDGDNYKPKYNIFIPKSLERIDCLDGLSGGHGGNGVGKIMDISNNPNFKLINGALYNADSSYVYLGTIGQYNNLLTITRNLKFDDDFFERLHYTQSELSIDSISFDEKNPYYSYFDHCIYTKQLDTLLYILPSVDNVRLSTNLKSIYVMDMPSDIHYEIPNDMPIEGLKECLGVFYNINKKFKLYGNEYTNKESDSVNQICKSEFIDTILKDNKNNPKLLCAKALLYLEDDYYYQAYELLDSIGNVSDSNPYFCTLLLDSCSSYMTRINTYIEEYKSTNSSNHDDMVEICLKLRDYFNNTADYLNTEVSVYNAFYNNWVLGAQESYNSRSYSLSYMEKGIPYALKLVNEFGLEKYRNDVSDFYKSLANVALVDNDNVSKTIQYAKKSLEFNPNNIEAYEALANYYFYYGSAEKNKKIKDIIIKVEKIAPNYKNSKDNILYQLLDNESIKLIK